MNAATATFDNTLFLTFIRLLEARVPYRDAMILADKAAKVAVARHVVSVALRPADDELRHPILVATAWQVLRQNRDDVRDARYA